MKLSLILLPLAILHGAASLKCEIQGNIDDACYVPEIVETGLAAASSAMSYIGETDDIDLVDFGTRRTQESALRGHRDLFSCPATLNQCLLMTGGDQWTCVIICGLRRRNLADEKVYKDHQLANIGESTRKQFCKAVEGTACACDDVAVVCTN